MNKVTSKQSVNPDPSATIGFQQQFQDASELDAAFFYLYLPADEQGQLKPARVAEGAVRDETDKEFATLTTAFPSPRHAVDYIMETFPIVKRKDEAAHGHYRTKQRILEIYDQMQQSIRTGTPYQSPLNPPPGPPTDEQGHFLSYTQINPADYPHIHPPRESDLNTRTEWQLTDLVNQFPSVPFTLRMGVSADAKRVRIQPVSTDKVQTGDQVVIAAEGLERGGQNVGAVFGKIGISPQVDATSGKPLTLVTVMTEQGLAKIKMSADDWAALVTIGIVD